MSILTLDERAAIDGGRWFSALSPSLRHDVLRCAHIRRYRHGELISARGDAPEEWMACARGAIRLSSTSMTGKLVTLDYVEPGSWMSDAAIFSGERRAHDMHAHSETTLLCVSRSDLRKILNLHVELYEALLRLQAGHIRLLLGLVEDLSTLPLRARLAKRLLHLMDSHGMPGLNDGRREVRIGLQLAQEEVAQLLGASRQRVNQELKYLKRERIIRIEAAGALVVCEREMLLRIAQTSEMDGLR